MDIVWIMHVDDIHMCILIGSCVLYTSYNICLHFIVAGVNSKMEPNWECSASQVKL